MKLISHALTRIHITYISRLEKFGRKCRNVLFLKIGSSDECWQTVDPQLRNIWSWTLEKVLNYTSLNVCKPIFCFRAHHPTFLYNITINEIYLYPCVCIGLWKTASHVLKIGNRFISDDSRNLGCAVYCTEKFEISWHHSDSHEDRTFWTASIFQQLKYNYCRTTTKLDGILLSSNEEKWFVVKWVQISWTGQFISVFQLSML